MIEDSTLADPISVGEIASRLSQIRPHRVLRYDNNLQVVVVQRDE